MNGRSMRLVTPRLVLKPIEDKDKDALLAMAEDRLITKSYMIPDFTSQEQRDAFFLRLQGLSQKEDRFVYGIFLGDELIGFLNECARFEDGVELGYFISSKQWNKGYATEALKAAIEELFRLGYKRIEAAHFVSNPASGRVMVKAGMKQIEKRETISYRGEDHPCIYYEIKRQ